MAKQRVKDQKTKTPEQIVVGCQHGGEGPFVCSRCYAAGLRVERSENSLREQTAAINHVLDLSVAIESTDHQIELLKETLRAMIEHRRQLSGIATRERRIVAGSQRKSGVSK